MAKNNTDKINNIQEVREQFRRLEESSKKYFESQKEDIKIKVQALKLPLSDKDILNLYIWIGRKQITISELPPIILENFQETSKFQSLLKQGFLE